MNPLETAVWAGVGTVTLLCLLLLGERAVYRYRLWHDLLPERPIRTAVRSLRRRVRSLSSQTGGTPDSSGLAPTPVGAGRPLHSAPTGPHRVSHG